MPKQIPMICKTCGQVFRYDESSYLLLAEKGESKPERCSECRKRHAKIITNLKVPYFPFKEAESYADFNLFPAGYTDHGERVLPEEEMEEDLSGMDVSITDEDVLALYQKLENNQVVVVVSPTGTGKSTYIPKRLLQPPENQPGDFVERLIRQGQIIITQPRILATERVSGTIAKILGTGLGAGQAVGFRNSEKDNSDRWNQIKIITDGTLPNWIREGRLGECSLIMVDEAHERSCNIDLILGFLKRELPKYPHLRVIISSATINTDKFLDTFKKANISVELLDIPSRKQFKKWEHWWKDEKPVEGCDCWLCRKSSEARREFWKNQKDAIKEYDLPEATANFALKILQEAKDGSVLIFLHGESTIDDTARRIKTRFAPVIPVYRRIQAKAERQLEITEGQRRVIVATNIAETSITIPDVVFVVNSGWIKQPEYDPVTQVTTLRPKLHSQDGDMQRAGRAGRNQNGYVYHLITKQQFDNENEIEKHTSAEITRCCLEDVVVSLKAAGIKDIEQFPWVEEPSEKPEMKKEIARAGQTLQTRGILDDKGEIVEYALEFLRIPRSSSDASLLYLADEQGSFFEVLTTLLLMSTRDGEARMGANLYDSYNGLLCWDKRWTAKTKAHVATVHQGLRVGCQDDLDFVIKLAYCFCKAEKKGLGERWASWHFLNYDVLQKIFEDTKDLIAKFGEEREESIRGINFGILEKVRSLIAAAWTDRVIHLKLGNPISYHVNGKVGVISPSCAGDWKKEKQALWGTVVEEEAVINGYPSECLVASFLVKPPDQRQIKERAHFLVDQNFPVGSQVQVKEEQGRTYLVSLIQLPQAIKVSYKDTLDTLEESPPEEKTVSFDKRFIEGMEISTPSEGRWVSDKKASQAKIIEWMERDGVPIAVLSPFLESPATRMNKKIGDTIRVRIHKVARDPVGSGGWIIAMTQSGYDIPVELSNMSMSPLGLGLERIEGQTLNLTVKELDEDSYLQLSNLDKVIEDLRDLRKQVTAKENVALKGCVEKIREEEEKVIVIVPRAFGAVHSFEVHKDFVPGKQIANLRMQEEVVVQLSLPSTQVDHVRADYFSQKEIKTVPSHLKHDDKKDELLFPYCLDEKSLSEWPARPEVVDFVRRHSWQYCLNARLVNTVSYREALSKLNVSARIVGKVQEETRNREGKSSGLNLSIQVNTSHGPFLLIGFLPLSELSWHRINSPFDIVSVDQELTCRILQIDTNIFPPTLVLSRKQAFIARAQIPYSKVGLLIGTGGNTIRSIIGASDVSIDTKNIPGNVMVYAASQSARDAVCRKISDKIWGMGDWVRT